jgi:hypothetical protein
VIKSCQNPALFQTDLPKLLSTMYPLWQEGGVWHLREQSHPPLSDSDGSNPALIAQKNDKDTAIVPLCRFITYHAILAKCNCLKENLKKSRLSKGLKASSMAKGEILEYQMRGDGIVKNLCRGGLKRIAAGLGIAMHFVAGPLILTLIQGSTMTHGMFD